MEIGNIPQENPLGEKHENQSDSTVAVLQCYCMEHLGSLEDVASEKYITIVISNIKMELNFMSYSRVAVTRIQNIETIDKTLISYYLLASEHIAGKGTPHQQCQCSSQEDQQGKGRQWWLNELVFESVW